MCRGYFAFATCSVALLHVVQPLFAQQPDAGLRDEVKLALRKGAAYYRGQVASHGGYVYYYAENLKERWGEGKTGPDTIFVQPPGTPTVGMAYLKAYAATGERDYLDAARATAEALVAGQLQSGGWAQVIHFTKPMQGQWGKYRNGAGGSWNVSSLDDGQTQAALTFLMLADKSLNFKHQAIHDAAMYGLDALLNAQYPIGAFPQGWRGPVVKHPVTVAKFPDYDWKTDGKIKDYYLAYTLNDNLAGSVTQTVLTAHEVYKEERFLRAIESLGDFLIRAQMPEPQPGWCQQYNEVMFPIWARKFEPPAIASSESQDVMRTLIKIAIVTKKPKYLEPIPRALAYFKTCIQRDGSIARYTEFKTNKPLYMNAKYELTYDDSDAPSHYGWKQPAHFDDIAKEYEAAKSDSPPRTTPPKVSITQVRKILAAQDQEGRWLSTYAGEKLVGQPKFALGFRYISSAVFSDNVEKLCDYLALK